MSVVRYPECMNSTDLQIWDNAAFDNGESEDSSAMFKSSWPHLKPVLFSSSESLDSFSSKENRNPLFENNRLAIKSHVPSKPIHHQNGRVKSTREQGSKSKSGNEEDVSDDGKNIDLEIEEIEKQISRLSSRLEALRIEKAEKFVKTAERRGGGGGRVVPAKFMEQKQSSKNGEEKKKVEEAIIMSSKVQTRRRGLSIGPSDIINGSSRVRRGGMSLGPVEISAGAIDIAAGKQQESENNNNQDEDESKRFDKKRSLSVGKSRPTPTQPEIKNSAAATEGRVKKRWEIPPTATTAISVVPDLLPSIRTTRCLIETPRDSGPAKRAAELVGRKSYFSIDEEMVCQALNFTEDDDDDEEEK